MILSLLIKAIGHLQEALLEDYIYLHYNITNIFNHLFVKLIVFLGIIEVYLKE